MEVHPYLHYWQEDIPDEVWANKIWYETKTEILERHLLDLVKREEVIKQKAIESKIDVEAVTQFISGSIFQGISGIHSSQEIVNENEETHIKPNMEPEEILGYLSSEILTFNTLDQFVMNLNKYLDSISEEAKNVMDAYVQDLINKASQNQFFKGQEKIDMGNLSGEAQILAAIMGKFNHDAFQLPPEQQAIAKYDASMVKLIALARVVQKCRPEIEKGMITRHGSVNSKNKGKFEKDLLLLDEIRKKTIAWLRQSDKSLKEISQGIGIVRAHLECLDNVDEKIDNLITNQVSLHHTGGKTYEVLFNPDKEMEELLKAIKYKRPYYRKVAKKDFSIDFSDTGGTVQFSLGANAKNYKQAISSNLKSYNLKIQDGTPMLTLLGREAGYTGYDLWTILQLASGISRNNDYEQANIRWDFLIQSMGYRSLLNALAGFEETNDQSFYMVINGKFWTMYSFIAHFLLSESKVGISEVIGERGRVAGLIRETYSNFNKHSWLADIENDGVWDNAMDRSDIVWQWSEYLMKNTKLRVEITIKEISKLMSHVL